MRRTSDQRNQQGDRTTRRLALFSCGLVLLIAAAGWPSPPSGAAGGLVPGAYVPLIASENEISVDLTATAEVIGTQTPTVTATATGEPAQRADVIGTVYLRPIFHSIENGQCIPRGGAAWLGAIDSAHTITDTLQRVQFGLPADLSVYGYAYLYDANGQALQTVSIQHDPKSGILSYKYTSLAAGVYSEAAYVAYQGDDRPTRITRIYDWILFPSLSHDTSLTFSLTPSQALGSTIPLDPLYLDLQGSVCPSV
jgi:hypothetical protein